MAELKRWRIPVTLTEFGRNVIVEAETKTAALQKLRHGDWEEMTDVDKWKVTKVGPCVEDV